MTVESSKTTFYPSGMSYYFLPQPIYQLKN